MGEKGWWGGWVFIYVMSVLAGGYPGMADLLVIDAQRPAHPVRLLKEMERIGTPLDWWVWAVGPPGPQIPEVHSGRYPRRVQGWI